MYRPRVDEMRRWCEERRTHRRTGAHATLAARLAVRARAAVVSAPAHDSVARLRHAAFVIDAPWMKSAARNGNRERAIAIACKRASRARFRDARAFFSAFCFSPAEWLRFTTARKKAAGVFQHRSALAFCTAHLQDGCVSCHVPERLTSSSAGEPPGFFRC